MSVTRSPTEFLRPSLEKNAPPGDLLRCNAENRKVSGYREVWGQKHTGGIPYGKARYSVTEPKASRR
jgi:hypothetical protein